MIIYLFKASLILAGCLLFYRVFLQRETFYRLNRFVLLACIILSFSLPLIPAPANWSLQKPVEQTATSAPAKTQSSLDLPVISSVPSNVVAPVEEPKIVSKIDLPFILLWAGRLYWTGVIIFALSLIIQTALLLFRAYTLPSVKDGQFRIIEISEDKAPCSFANNIFINPTKYDLETYDQILVHEKLHVSQRHSIDIIFAELAIIFLWFNPIAWFYRRDIENNLEFLTDAHLVDHEAVDLKSYQMSLLKVSVPHYPLSITTNYNQSLLKERVFKLNSKRSNLNTTWKYFFLLPLMFGFVCVLNEPIAKAGAIKNSGMTSFDGRDEGHWFAVVKNDTIQFQFKRDLNDKSLFGSRFAMAEIKDLKSGVDSFSLAREAGKVVFRGKLENNQGMGTYKFKPDAMFKDFLRQENISVGDGDDMLTYFMVGLTRSYVTMLKKQGYSRLTKNDLVPLSALNVDADFINALRESGFQRVDLHDLVALKSLGIDKAYIEEIRKAGYPNITIHQLITFKAQHIDAKYINAVRSASGQVPSPSKISPPANPSNGSAPPNANVNELVQQSIKEHQSANTVSSMKSLNVSGDYKKQFEDMGYQVSDEDLVSLKSLKITPEYINSLVKLGKSGVKIKNTVLSRGANINESDVEMYKKAGYLEIRLQDVITAKSLGINSAYIKLWEDAGFGLVPITTLISLKSMNVTPSVIKEYQNAGFSSIRLEQAISLKGLRVTPELIKSYRELGFPNVTVNDVTAATATGTTPSYIAAMMDKGYKFDKIDKYIATKRSLERRTTN